MLQDVPSQDLPSLPGIDHPDLDPSHLAALHASAISDEVIISRGYRTVRSNDELRKFGFAPAQCKVPGLLLPVHTTDGGNGLAVYRPDNPRVLEDRSKRNPDGTHPCKVLKYEFPKGESMRLDCPPKCQPLLGDPSMALWITEGQKKADAMASAGLCAIALLGVWNFKGKNEFGSSTFLADWDYIGLQGRDIRIIFDSDILTKHEVRSAIDRLTEHLQRKGAMVTAVYLPHGENGKKLGVDDWLAAGHSVNELEALVEAPHPAPKPAPVITELLDASPVMMSRPLSLLEGRGYAATWLYTKTTRSESVNRQGEIVRHNPPMVTTARKLFIVRDDGVIFGEGGNHPLDDIGLEIYLAEIPPVDKLWSTQAVKSYAAGRRPIPAEVFNKVVDIVDRFIDFDRSLADQRTMSELVACYIMSTWLLDAFSVTGFLWPNGDRGTGKTHLLIIVTELAFLGALILAGGSFASLRDLADYGATLGFDDAENMADPRKTDPDKRALLLAGNRRGVTIPLKELAADKTWHTRHVNAFCPRLFSATRIPDPILSSRTIVIPLIRTADRKRANTDPLDYSAWPHEHQALIDDLWALALFNLPKLPEYDTWAGNHARLAGRALQPWRAILAIAAWLDQNGVPDLWSRMEGLSMSYQAERPDLEMPDLTSLAIRSISDICDVSGISGINIEKGKTFKTKEITEKIISMVKDEDLDIDPEFITSRRVGRTLAKMRFRKMREGGTGARCWFVSADEINHLKSSYGIGDISMQMSQVSETSQTSQIEIETALLHDLQEWESTHGDIGDNPDDVTSPEDGNL